MKRVLIAQTGSAPPPLRARHGDFTQWFSALLAPRATVAIVDAEREHLPDPAACAASFDGVLVTGSLKSVTRPEPWMEALGGWLLRVSAQRPILGVCFGHQLLAHALGGRVERHPQGPEAGTVEVELTEAGRRDPLMTGIPSSFAAQEVHEDHVPEPPPGAVVLARSAHAPIQAFAHGPRLRGIQFHPEFDADRARDFIDVERAWLEAARDGLAAKALASVRPTPHAVQVLHNWVDAFV